MAVIWGLNGRTFWKGLAFVHSEREWEEQKGLDRKRGPLETEGGEESRHRSAREAGWVLLAEMEPKAKALMGTARA